MKHAALVSSVALGMCVAAFGVGVGCTQNVIIAPSVDAAAAPAEAAAVEDVAPLPPPVEEEMDAGYCFGKGPKVDASSAEVFGNCVPHDMAEDTVCIEYAGIGVSFAEKTVKTNCMTDLLGTWTKTKPCTRTNLAGGCRQISRISNLCETVITYWYAKGGDAGTTEADVMARCAKQGNAEYLPPP